MCFLLENPHGSQRDSSDAKVLALHAADSNSFPGNAHGPLSR